MLRRSALGFVCLAVGFSGMAGAAVAGHSSQNKSLTSDFSASTLAKKVDAHYNQLHSLCVQFTETYNGMGMTRTETGTLWVAKPNRMKWSYTKPAGKLFVVNGKYGYSYTPGDAQAERYPAKELSDFRSPLRFLLGHTRIEKELSNLQVTQNGTGYELRGVPQGMAARVSDVELTISSEGTIQGIRWKETDGATTEFDLNGEVTDPPIPSGTFTFHAPPGVVVVRGMAPI